MSNLAKYLAENAPESDEEESMRSGDDEDRYSPIKTRNRSKLDAKKSNNNTYNTPGAQNNTNNANMSETNLLDNSTLIKFHDTIRKTFKKFLNYEAHDLDLHFIDDLYEELPKLTQIWDRIGFNEQTKAARLERFYNELTDKLDNMVVGEIELEENILKKNELNRKKIKELCLELQTKYDENLFTRKMTVLEQQEMFANEVKKLEAEKKKRVENYKQFANEEGVLCERLRMKKTEQRLTVPTEKEINHIQSRIKELQKLFNERLGEMSFLKDEISSLVTDLEVSHSDSFAETIVFEAVDVISLGDEDLKRAHDLYNQLKQKDSDFTEETKSLKIKIRELWTKLSIEEETLKDIVYDKKPTSLNPNSNMTKREILIKLRVEHDKCVELKMQNMQKFIENIRSEIRSYCTKMYMGPKELKCLESELLGSNDYNEKLLTQHEEKLEDMKFRFTENEHLYDKTEKWMNLYDEYVIFEEKTKDPNRFKTRGYNMLKEEKQRKVFQNQLPKLESELDELAASYQEMNGGQEYTVNGLHYLEYIARKKQDHEQSKLNERKEKQILRDNIKWNESKFGSKPATPLALRNKRKLTNNGHETELNTPNLLLRSSKVFKTDMTVNETGTPSILKSTRVSSIKSSYGPISKKLIATKRKSRTPGKSRIIRRSKLAVKSGDNQEQDLTIITTNPSVSTSSSISSIANSTNASSNSKLFSNSRGSNTSNSKHPPVSSSSRYGKAAHKSPNCFSRMTSTASNTIIEEDNAENETPAVTNKKSDHLFTVTAAAKIVAAKKISNENKLSKNGYPFHNANKIVTSDVNYFEFSRDLASGTTKLGDSTNFTETKTVATSIKTTTTTNSRIARPTLMR